MALAFFYKILATAVTLETGGSGGIVTPLFFIGATSGVALAHAAGLDPGVIAAFGFVSVLAGAANTPLAAAVMGMELLPTQVGVYAALCAGTAFLTVGHRSVYASQKLGLSKSGGLDVPMDVSIGDIGRGRDAAPEGQPDRVPARQRPPHGQTRSEEMRGAGVVDQDERRADPGETETTPPQRIICQDRR